jgi:peptide-methionine (S)-S-oxide reductase
MATATFAAGCFWGVETDFRSLPGVLDAEVGYTGGHKENPTYREVSSHKTGHTEAVRVEFDPDVISYRRLVEAFYAMHDPTTLNRQGLDLGSQYRSAIFFHSPEQEATAREVTEQLERSGTHKRPIVTEITQAGPWWPAEDYHQRYLEKRGRAACQR